MKNKKGQKNFYILQLKGNKTLFDFPNLPKL